MSSKHIANKTYRGITIAFLLLLLAMAVLVVPAFYIFTHKPLPQVQGDITVDGIEKRITVIRDGNAVPHIYASTRHDLFFASGFVQAQDRLFQMDLMRRLSEGRLAEWLGEDALDSDRFARVIGFGRAARRNFEHLPTESMEAVMAYTEGVNAYIERRKSNLPLEYRVFGAAEPWTPVDTLAVTLYIGWGLTGDWRTELLRLGLATEGGVERAFQVMPMYESGGPYIIPEPYWPAPARDGDTLAMMPYGLDPDRTRTAASEILRMDSEFRKFINPATSASNSWVVDGSLTESGKPILCNDPHLQLTLPSVWYEMHLVGPGHEATGVTFPGVPLIVLGHTRDIAWAATTTGADMDDLFVEELHPDDPYRYRYRDKWEKFEVVEEVILVKDGEGPFREEKVEVRISRHGPVIDDVVDVGPERDRAITLAWTGHRVTDGVGAFMAVAEAKDWESFKKGIQKLGCPVQNWLYADVNGNIGYIAAGLFPVRPNHNGTFPAPGTGEYDWQGFVPLDDLPQLKNPARGYILTANNKVMPEETVPYTISVNYDPPYRAIRIEEMLLEKGGKKWDADALSKLQMDVLSVRARRLLPVFLSALDKERGGDDDLDRAWRQLEGWDAEMDEKETAPTLFASAYWHALRFTYEDEMAPELFRLFTRIQAGENAFDNILESGDSGLFDDQRTAGVEDRDDIIVLAVKAAVDELSEEAGARMTEWEWGRFHVLKLEHPIGQAPQFRRVADWFNVNQGPIPLSGGRNTVNKGAWPLGEGFEIKGGPSMRHVVDMAAIPEATMSYPGGQSGQPFSPHYSDFLEGWTKGEGHRMLIDREDITGQSKATITLNPPGFTEE